MSPAIEPERGKRFGGRTRQKAMEAGSREHLGIRVTPDLKTRLVIAATQAGRSISQETEFRLERSFDRDAIQQQLEEILALLRR